MFASEIKQENKILSALVVLMLLTRFHHFGDINTFPDATLAVFFRGRSVLQTSMDFAFIVG